jgi:hypothetical protein
MNGRLHRKLEALIRVRAHCDAHPDPDPGWQIIAARLRDGIARAEALAARQLDGTLHARALADHRRQLRARLHRHCLVLLARIAAAASREEPGLSELFRLPDSNGAHTTWRITARRMAAEARARREFLTGYGLPGNLLQSLDAGLDEFEATFHHRAEATSLHVGATAALRAVMAENMKLVDHLEALNLYRLRNDPALLASWKSARYLGIWKTRRKPAKAEQKEQEEGREAPPQDAEREPDSPPSASPAPSLIPPVPSSLFPVPRFSQLA